MELSPLFAWPAFALSAAVVVLAGTRLSHYGHRIAELSGLGGLWIGAVLMAAATSLPELFTDISAALLAAPDLAVGDLFGSSMVNMLVLGIIDLVHRQKRVWQQAALEHALMAGLAVVLTALAALFLSLESEIPLRVAELECAFIALLYLLGMRIVYRQESARRRQREMEKVVEAAEALTGEAPDRPAELLRAALGFATAAGVILVSAPILALSAREIAEATGISTSFVGSSLLAVTTSLPELVTALAAVRLGAFDLAVGNLFGSNAFNMAALFAVDLAQRPGALLTSVAPVHAISALVAILLMNIGIMGLLYRAEKRILLIEPDSALMIVGYALGMGLLFLAGG